jgi:hypothetical protein
MSSETVSRKRHKGDEQIICSKIDRSVGFVTSFPWQVATTHSKLLFPSKTRAVTWWRGRTPVVYNSVRFAASPHQGKQRLN